MSGSRGSAPAAGTARRCSIDASRGRVSTGRLCSKIDNPCATISRIARDLTRFCSLNLILSDSVGTAQCCRRSPIGAEALSQINQSRTPAGNWAFRKVSARTTEHVVAGTCRTTVLSNMVDSVSVIPSPGSEAVHSRLPSLSARPKAVQEPDRAGGGPRASAALWESPSPTTWR
jgi:hypothetical protein